MLYKKGINWGYVAVWVILLILLAVVLSFYGPLRENMFAFLTDFGVS